jgi:predicted component of type VI protein secretion system
MTKVDRSDELESLLEQVLQKDEQLKRMSSELGSSAPEEKK